MFYVKTNLADGVSATMEITDENVYTRCPECGSEVQVDLADLFRDGEADLYGTAVYCAGCSQRRVDNRDASPEPRQRSARP